MVFRQVAISGISLLLAQNEAFQLIALVAALKVLHHLVGETRRRDRHRAPAKLTEIEETRRDIPGIHRSAYASRTIVVSRQTDGYLNRQDILGARVAAQERETSGYDDRVAQA